MIKRGDRVRLKDGDGEGGTIDDGRWKLEIIEELEAIK